MFQVVRLVCWAVGVPLFLCDCSVKLLACCFVDLFFLVFSLLLVLCVLVVGQLLFVLHQVMQVMFVNCFVLNEIRVKLLSQKK